MNTNIPRPEYPRPQFVREAWMNLNGQWQFEIDVADSGFERGLLHRNLQSEITVPFCRNRNCRESKTSIFWKPCGIAATSKRFPNGKASGYCCISRPAITIRRCGCASMIMAIMSKSGGIAEALPLSLATSMVWFRAATKSRLWCARALRIGRRSREESNRSAMKTTSVSTRARPASGKRCGLKLFPKRI